MAQTTMLKRRAEMRSGPLERCHDGQGALDWWEVLHEGDAGCAAMWLFHDDVLPPGASIGVHRHERETEYYYILEGRGTMTLDGERFTVESGDLAAVFPGGSHGLVNDGPEPMRIIVVGLKTP